MEESPITMQVAHDLRSVITSLKPATRKGRGKQLEAALNRLLWLLDLCPEEKGFVLDALKKPRDFVNLAIFADYLQDMQRPDDAEILERITPQTGDLLVCTLPPTGGRWNHRAEQQVLRDLKCACLELKKRGRSLVATVIPHGAKLETANSSTLRRSGWMREEEAKDLQDACMEATKGTPEAQHMARPEEQMLDLVSRLKKENAELRAELAEKDGMWQKLGMT